MIFASPTAEIAVDALRRAGITVAPECIQILQRDGRWMIDLPENQIAWFAASDQGRMSLMTERRVLHLLTERAHLSPLEHSTNIRKETSMFDAKFLE